MFVGDDWFQTPKWKQLEKKFKEVFVRIEIFIHRAKRTSSTLLNETYLKN